MNASDILKYGHLWVHQHLEGLTDEQCLTPGVCGVWSTKEIIAHLTSFEWLLVDVFAACATPGPVATPILDQYTTLDGDAFNAVQVGMRRNQIPGEALQEYNEAYAKAISILPSISEHDLRTPGTLPWYGLEYALDDLIVYQYYGHKREHCAQIAVYRDSLK